MATFQIRKGRNIKLKGAAKKEIINISSPTQVAIQPPDFKGLKPRLTVKVDDTVKVGSPIITDKSIENLKLVSPVSGKVVAVNRGEKRTLLEIVIESDGNQEAEVFDSYSKDKIKGLNRETVTKNLLNGGLWATIRQRPFNKIANPNDTPKSIFVHAMSTEPLALEIDAILENKEKEFQVGLDIIGKLTEGDVHVCIDDRSQSKALTDSKNVQIHGFTGPHPTGNVGTHIHYVDPINKGEVVWYIEAQDVLRVAQLFLNGAYPTEKIVAITGEGAKNRVYAKTVEGAPLSALLQGSDLSQMRCITGSVLSGRDVGPNGFVGFYDHQISIIPTGGERKFLGWLGPGFNKFTFSHTYASSFLPQGEVSLDTDKNGSDRAIVLNHVYDSLNALDVVTYFLLKAIIAGDIEEAEKLGILECDEEDFALCTFACPSKTDVGGIIQAGLDVIEQEG